MSTHRTYKVVRASSLVQIEVEINALAKQHYALHTFRHVLVPSPDDLPTASSYFVAVMEGTAEGPKEANATPEAMALKD